MREKASNFLVVPLLYSAFWNTSAYGTEKLHYENISHNLKPCLNHGHDNKK